MATSDDVYHAVCLYEPDGNLLGTYPQNVMTLSNNPVDNTSSVTNTNGGGNYSNSNNNNQQNGGGVANPLMILFNEGKYLI